ncbi:MAG TPA: TolC family protein [Flavobacterium sp.]|jgi:outer membrane protein TolC
MKKIYLLLLVLLSIPANSQEALTFADCLERALKNNLDIKSAEMSERVSVIQHRASYGGVLPNIYGEVENRNSWGKELDPDTNTFKNDNLRNYEGTLNAAFNLFSGFSVYHSVRAAKQEKDISRAALEQTRNLITIDLAQRYISILYLQEIIEANQEQIKSSEKQLELAELKFNSGAIAESEVFKIRAQKAAEELNLLTSQNQLAENMISLKQLMNMPLDQDVLLIQPSLELNENITESEDAISITSRAVERHPAFRMSLLEEKRARTELALKRAAFYPTLSMRLMMRSNYNPEVEEQVGFKTQLDENTSRQIRFYLVVPIFNGFSAYSEARASKALWKQAKITREIERNRLSKEVLLAINNTKTSMKKNQASIVAFDFSQKSFEADALKFEMGKINISELSITKLNYNNTQAELIQSKYELLFNNALIKFYLGEDFVL